VRRARVFVPVIGTLLPNVPLVCLVILAQGVKLKLVVVAEQLTLPILLAAQERVHVQVIGTLLPNVQLVLQDGLVMVALYKLVAVAERLTFPILRVYPVHVAVVPVIGTPITGVVNVNLVIPVPIVQ